MPDTAFPCPHCGEPIDRDALQPGPRALRCPHCAGALDPARDIPTGAFEAVEVPDAGDGEEGSEAATQPWPSDSPAEPSLRETLEDIWGASLESDLPIHATVGRQRAVTGSASRLVVKPRLLAQGGDATGQEDQSADYELLEVLGEGGMGVVYLARQTSIDRLLAVKMVQGRDAAGGETRERFLSEAAVTGELDHPNIVPVHDLGTDESGNLFYSMKQVKGTCWKDVLPGKPQGENLDILMRVADAVAFAHAKGAIHRDLKPENVMLGDYGEVMLMDWGLAASASGTVASEAPAQDAPQQTGKAPRLTESNACCGTPAYMAPEMALGQHERIGPASDIYLLGAILYEIVTDLVPHTGKTVIECLVHASENRIQPTDKTGELVDIAKKAMAAEPDDRYDSVKAFQQAIRQYEAHAESVLLSDRAAEELAKAGRTQDYDDYAQALFGYRQALDLWHENAAARRGVLEASLAYASCAHAKGDLDLAASLLQAAPAADAGEDSIHPLTQRHTELLHQVEATQAERTARIKRLARLRLVATAAGILIIAILTAAYLWISAEQERTAAERDRAVLAEADALAQKEHAITIELEATRERDRAVVAEKDALAQKARAEDALTAEAQQRQLAETARQEAEEEAHRAKAVTDLITNTLATADPTQRGRREVTVRAVMDAMAKLVETNFRDDPRTRQAIEATVGHVYAGLGEYATAKPHLESSRQLARALFGEKHPSYASALSNLARLYQEQGDYSKAAPLYKQALEILRKALGTQHPDYASTLSNLALLYKSKGEYTKAKTLLQEALQITRNSLGEEHSDYAARTHNLAGIYHALGNYNRAESCFQKALETTRRALGAAHPQYAAGLSNLAGVHHAQGEYARAEALLQKALEIDRKALGEEHPAYATDLRNLAILYTIQGRYSKAEALFQQALELYDKNHQNSPTRAQLNSLTEAT